MPIAVNHKLLNDKRQEASPVKVHLVPFSLFFLEIAISHFTKQGVKAVFGIILWTFLLVFHYFVLILRRLMRMGAPVRVIIYIVYITNNNNLFINFL